MLDLNGKLRLHADFNAATVCVGAEREPVIVIDNFLSDPDVLVTYCARHSVFDGVSDTFYPGSRAPIPPIYCFALRAFLGAVIAKTFGLGDSVVTGELAHFSMVTTPPERLGVVQRMPHFDSTNPRQFALLHYLCGAKHGGTSFYRHRGTRFEHVDAARSRAYGGAVTADLASLGAPPAKYICGDDAMFERTHSFAAAFNRLLIYRSINLHSADIGPAFDFDADPRRGRLTANTFFFYS
ncbi:MAG: DUF6445 family protein [Steroidobacteraceae bacterium]